LRQALLKATGVAEPAEFADSAEVDAAALLPSNGKASLRSVQMKLAAERGLVQVLDEEVAR